MIPMYVRWTVAYDGAHGPAFIHPSGWVDKSPYLFRYKKEALELRDEMRDLDRNMERDGAAKGPKLRVFKVIVSVHKTR